MKKPNLFTAVPLLLAVTLVLIVSIALIGCVKERATDKGTIRMGYQELTVNAPFFRLFESAELRDAGVMIEPVKFQTTNQIVDALIAGNIDATGIIAAFPVLSVEDQSPGTLKIFGANQQTVDRYIDHFVIGKDSDIAGYEDLVGKTVGLFPGSSTESIVKIILQKRLGDDASKVALVQLPPSQHVQSLASGRVDALFTLDPLATLAEEKGAGRILVTAPMSKEVLATFTLGAAAVREDFAAKNKTLMNTLIQHFAKAITEVYRDKELQSQLIAKYTPVPETTARNSHIGNIVSVPNVDAVAFQKLADIYYDNGLLENEPSVSALILSQ